jgi:hypothetical protein
MKHIKTDASRGEICKEMEKRCQLNTWTNRQCLTTSSLGSFGQKQQHYTAVHLYRSVKSWALYYFKILLICKLDSFAPLWPVLVTVKLKNYIRASASMRGPPRASSTSPAGPTFVH